MTAGIFIKKLTFSNNETIDLQDNSIVVFVGPNNSGKSLTLREIFAQISKSAESGKAVRSIEIQKIGNAVDLVNTLEPFSEKNQANKRFLYSEHYSVLERHAIEIWKNASNSIGELANFFVGHLTTKARLNDCDPATSFDAISRRGGHHPIHHLYQDYGLEKHISSLFHRAFGEDIVLHRMASAKIPLYVGKRPEPEVSEGLTDRSYLDKIERLEPLEEQGDGFKSFASLLLRVWTGINSILLLDEPEAFLHPPQARMVGELISSGTSYQKQIFISTHSNDVIQGLISSHLGRVSIIRIVRNDEGATFTKLPNERVAELWRDPILRYSNVLNGLFHKQVVVTESDGDCKFYEAINDCIIKTDSIFYTYSGGKDRMPTIIRALRVLNVPVKVIVDFDIIANNHPLRDIIEANGYDWSAVENDVANIRNVITERKSWILGAAFKEKVSSNIQEIPDNSIVPNDKLTILRSLLRQASPWDAVKTAGMAAVPSGEPTRKLLDLMQKLRKDNIFVVPEGEMEGFCRSVGSHGPRWVEEVLRRDICNDEELAKARKFVYLVNHSENKIDMHGREEITAPKRVDMRLFYTPVIELVKRQSPLFRALEVVLEFLGLILIALIVISLFRTGS